MGIPFNEAIGLLLYLAPGFLAMQLYRVSYPAKRMSQFENVAWSIVHSFIILLGLAGTSWIFDNNDFNLFNLNRDAPSSLRPYWSCLSAGSSGISFSWGFIGYVNLFPSCPTLTLKRFGRLLPLTLLMTNSGHWYVLNKVFTTSVGLINTLSIRQPRIMNLFSVLPISWMPILQSGET